MRHLLNVIAGLVIPIRISSRLYLADQLQRFGVEVSRLPKPCLQDLADDIMHTTRNVAALTHKGWREITTDHLEGAAGNIALLLLGEPPLDGSPAEYDEHFAAIIRKHGVPLPL